MVIIFPDTIVTKLQNEFINFSYKLTYGLFLTQSLDKYILDRPIALWWMRKKFHYQLFYYFLRKHLKCYIVFHDHVSK